MTEALARGVEAGRRDDFRGPHDPQPRTGSGVVGGVSSKARARRDGDASAWGFRGYIAPYGLGAPRRDNA